MRLFFLLLIGSLIFTTGNTYSNNYTEEDKYCLALAIYFEARDQPVNGQIAVGLVILNRVESNKFPNDICSVVTQSKYRNNKIVLNKCQFSFYCDGKSDVPKDIEIWNDIVILSNFILYNIYYDFTLGSLFYHNTEINTPIWTRDMIVTLVVKDHIFYRDDK